MRRALLALLLLAGMVIPASGAFGQAAEGGSLGIRLVDPPPDADPRARLYIVDHVAPGTTIRRQLEVTNSSPEPQRIELYAAAADIKDGAFLGRDGREANEVSEWITVEPPVVDLPPGGRALATATVAVPTDAAEGERYAAIWAELPPVAPQPGDQGVTLVNRVGVRVYLFVGPGGAPPSDFSVNSLVAARNRDGRPVVNAVVENTGRRALDLGGELRLEDGPGGLRAGPFRAQTVTTLEVGGVGAVHVELDAAIPLGPWEATMTLRSGSVERHTRARITFPEANEASNPPVTAETVEDEQDDLPAGLILGGAVVLGVLVGLLLARRRRRRAA
ncbi:MAG TPA: hypothetical protein VHE80_00440 [Acidimicrobiales bacterium]|nr:hypothetical protein [Acidimicrobiales bacterium]